MSDDDDTPKEPVWEKGTIYPLECAIWVWATRLIQYGKEGGKAKAQEWIDGLLKHHKKEVVDQVVELARRRWNAEKANMAKTEPKED